MFELTKVNDVFADYNIQLAEAKKKNENEVFDYETIAGNKAARSHVYKLRQAKSGIEKARKKAKQESLDFGRALDTEGNRLKAELDEMIEVHETPLKAIEEKEKTRIARIMVKIEAMKLFQNVTNEELSSSYLQGIYDKIFNLSINDEFAEFKTLALETKDLTLKKLVVKITALKKQEAETAELERLRIEKIERDQKEHDERIAREAKAEAERKAHEDSIRKEYEAKEVINQAEREKQQAIDAAERAKREQIAQEERAKIEREQAIEREKIAVEQAKQAEIDRQNAEKKLIADEQLKRESNKKHIGNIRRDAKDSIMELGFTESQAKQLVMAIHNKQIVNVTINY